MKLRSSLLICCLTASAFGFDFLQSGQRIQGSQTYELSGSAVDLSYDGSIVVIGSPNASSAGLTSQGMVRVYMLIQMYAGTWVQLGTDILGDSSGENFGSSVSIANVSDTHVLAISSPSYTHNGVANAGRVRVYIFNSTSNDWEQLSSDILPQGGGAEGLGTSLSMSSDGATLSGVHIAIGSPYWNSNIGRVGIYSFDSSLGAWALGCNFEGPGPGEMGNILFGKTVSLSDEGAMVAIGSPEFEYYSHGRVQVFRSKTTLSYPTCSQYGSPIYGFFGTDEKFGTTVSLKSDFTLNGVASTTTLAVSSRYTERGHVLVYRMADLSQPSSIDMSWNQFGNTLQGAGETDRFGESLSLSESGNILAIGAPLWGNNQGRVYVHKYDSASSKWNSNGFVAYAAYIANGDDAVGSAVALSANGDTVVVGANQTYKDNSLLHTGFVEVWTEVPSPPVPPSPPPPLNPTPTATPTASSASSLAD